MSGSQLLGADGQTALEAKESFQGWIGEMLQSVHRKGYKPTKMLSGDIPFANAEHDPNEPTRRRARRRIPELIARELSFSGQAMTGRQIAKAID